jgi:hypothetical protein
MISSMAGTAALDNELSKGSVTAETVTLGRLFATAEEEEEELLTELPGSQSVSAELLSKLSSKRGESEEELLTEMQESSELLLVSANSASVAVSQAQKREAATATDGGDGSTLVHLSNFQTTLKYVTARSALTKVSEERIPQIVPVIHAEQEKIIGDQGNDAKFYFCLHVGTTAAAHRRVIKEGLLDRRFNKFKKALDQSGAFKDALVFGEGIPHFTQPDNFATFMMKTYTGDVEPSCNAEDLEAQ